MKRKSKKHVVDPRFQEWLDSHYRPIAGADGEDDQGNTADGGDNNTDSHDDDTDTSDSTDDDTDHSSDSSDDDHDSSSDADDDELDRIKRERDEARDRVARAEAAAQKAKQEARKAREEAAKKHGNWEQVAREREAELADANERATNAEQRAVTAEENLDKFQREVRVTRIAARLSFRDPKDAMDKLAGNVEATGDDKSCERALRTLAKEKPYLIDERRARGRALTGNGNGSGFLTKEQMEKMSPEEINAAWEKGMIQQSLANLPRSGGG